MAWLGSAEAAVRLGYEVMVTEGACLPVRPTDTLRTFSSGISPPSV